MDGAKLQQARLQGADLRGTSLQKAKLTGAKYDAATRWPSGFDPQAAGAVLTPSL